MKRYSRVLIGGLAGLLSLGNPRKVISDVIIKTTLPQTQLVADGTTVYTLEVRANTMEMPDLRFPACDWDVVVPSYVNVVGAELPSQDNPSTNPDDFFFNYLMNSSWNRVDSTIDGAYELTDNIRIANSAGSSPMNQEDSLLGKYFITINNGALPQNGNFDLNNISFSDINFNEYNDGAGVQVQNQPFTIYSPADVNRSGGQPDANDVQDFVGAVLGTNPTYAANCDLNHDGVVNGNDIRPFVQAMLGQ